MCSFVLGGVTCYDACTKQEFQLHAHIMAWTGDIPALTKIMNVIGHNSYSECRFCDIWGEYSQKHKHVYFPPNRNYTNRNHSDWISYIDEIEAAETNREKEELIRQYGKYLFIILLLNYCYLNSLI